MIVLDYTLQRELQSCSRIDFEVFHSIFDTCVLLRCAVTELVLVLKLAIELYEYKQKEARSL